MDERLKDLALLLQKGLDAKNPKIVVGSLRFVIYARKSTNKEDNQERSLDDQLNACRDYAQKNNLNVVEELFEAESAYESGIRPVFNQMINDLRANKYDGIIAWDPSRLARNMKEGGEIIDLWDRQIIKSLHFPTMALDDSQMGKMMLGLFFVLAKQYSDSNSLSVTRGMKRSLDEGKYTSKAKHGYLKDRNGYMRPDGENFVLIKKAFEMRLGHHTLPEICDFLNANGYQRFISISKPRQPYQFRPKVLSEMFKDPFYSGVLIYGDQVYVLQEKYDFLPVLTYPLYKELNGIEAISKAETAVKRSGVVAGLLTRHVICGECNTFMKATITRKKLKGYFYYRCTTPDCPCYQKSVRANVVMTFIFAYLNRVKFTNQESYELIKKEVESGNKKLIRSKELAIQILKKEKANLLAKIDRLKAEILSNKSPIVREEFAIDLEEAKIKLEQTEANVLTAEQELRNMRYADTLSYEKFFELFDNLAYILKKVTVLSELSKILEKVFLNFVIKNGKVASYKLKPLFAKLEKTAKNSQNYGWCTRGDLNL